MIHDLKCRSEYFNAIIDGTKKFEVRLNDRDYHVGDTLALHSVNGSLAQPCPPIVVKVTYMINDPEFVKENYVILGIEISEYQTLLQSLQWSKG